jgi:tellurite resistance protein
MDAVTDDRPGAPQVERVPPAPGLRRIPPNIFAISFGLAGLAEAWVITADQNLTPSWLSDILFILSAATWLSALGVYFRWPGNLRIDLADNITSPFVALPLIVPMLLAAEGLNPHSHAAATVLVDVFLALTALYGGWLTGQWICAPLDVDKLHPGYFLPTVAGGLVASAAASAVGQRRLGEVMFGFGLVCWLILGSILMNRLFVRPRLPDPLLPTLAIEVAPPAVASLAWLALNGGRVDAVAAGLAGYGVLMVLVQLRLLPPYLRLRFGIGTWAFTFSWAAVASTLLIWLDVERPGGHTGLSYAVLAAISLFIGGVAVRTVVALARGQLLPPA